MQIRYRLRICTVHFGTTREHVGMPGGELYAASSTFSVIHNAVRASIPALSNIQKGDADLVHGRSSSEDAAARLVASLGLGAAGNGRNRNASGAPNGAAEGRSLVLGTF